MKAKHTPGPWTVTHKIDGRTAYGISTAADYERDKVSCEATVAHVWSAGNAALIAAAPDLLAALEIAKMAINAGGRVSGDGLQIIDDAIAKAKFGGIER